MTVVLVAAEDGAADRTRHWVEVLEGRGHDVYLVAPLQAPTAAVHHVTTHGGTADTLRAIADAMEGVPAPVLLLDATALGSPVTVEEVEAAVGTVVLTPDASSDAAADLGQAPVRIVSGVVVAAGSAVHRIAEPTDRCVGLLRVDGSDADDVADALRVMGDVAAAQEWHGPAWPLTVVAAVRAGVIVRATQTPGLPWGTTSEDLDSEQEAHLRVRVAAGEPQGLVDRWVGRPIAIALALLAWRAGVGAHAVTAVSVAAGLLAGLLISSGTRTGITVAACFFLASVLLDRVDGVLARARRTVTAFGAWLDATSAWLREVALVVGLAVGAAQYGMPRWTLATTVLVLLTAAHLAAAASRTSHGWGGTPVPVRLPLDRLDESAVPVAPPLPGRPVPRWLPFSISRGDGAVLAVAGLLVLTPAALLALLAALAVVSAVACLLLVGAPRPLPAAQRQLFELADPGPLARLVSKQDPQLSLLRRLLTTRMAAWVPPITWLAESAVVLVAAIVAQSGELLSTPPLAADSQSAVPVTIAWIAVLAFHRRDVATRQRVLETPPPSWLGVVGLGALGRSLLVVVMAALGVLAWGLAIGAIVLGVLYAAESSSRFAER